MSNVKYTSHILRPNQVWTTDITYIKKELVLETLNNAFKKRNYPIGVISHSDKGTQYRSHAFRELIIKNKCLYSYTSL